jgi:hypothetical protein
VACLSRNAHREGRQRSPVVAAARGEEVVRNRNVFTFVAALASLSCGGDENKKNDDEEGRIGGNASAVCQRICARSQAARCDEEPKNCAATCESMIEAAPSKCDDALEAFTSCAEKATFTCDSSDEAEAKSCSKQLSAWESCADGDDPGADDDDGDDEEAGDDDGPTIGRDDPKVPTTPTRPTTPTTPTTPVRDDEGTDTNLTCEPEDDDEECFACAKTSCCSQLSACGDDCLAVFECVLDCETTSCEQACVKAGTPGVTQATALASCQVNSCKSECASEDDGEADLDEKNVISSFIPASFAR